MLSGCHCERLVLSRVEGSVAVPVNREGTNSMGLSHRPDTLVLPSALRLRLEESVVE